MVVDPVARTQTQAQSSAGNFGEFLIAQGALSKQALKQARQWQQGHGEKLQKALLRLNLLSEQKMAAALAKYHKTATVDANKYPTAALLQDEYFSAEFFQRAEALPIYVEEKQIVLAMADPADESVIQAVQVASGKRVLPRVGLLSDIQQAQARVYGDRELDQKPSDQPAEPVAAVPAVTSELQTLAETTQNPHRDVINRRIVRLRPPSVISRSFMLSLLVAVLVVTVVLMMGAKVLVDLLRVV